MTGGSGDPYVPVAVSPLSHSPQPRQGPGRDLRARDRGEDLPYPGRPSGQDAYWYILASHSLSHTEPLPLTAAA